MGSALLDQKRDKEALDFLTKAKSEAEADPRIDFNRGVALYRLKKRGEARQAWKAAADNGLQRAAEYLQELEKRGAQSGVWIDFWFSGNSGWYRRLFGILLIFMLSLVSMLPIIKKDSLASVPWLNTGQEWTVIATPLLVLGILLALPSLSSLSVGPVKLEPKPSHPESAPAAEAGFEALVGTLQSMRPTLTVGADVAPLPTADIVTIIKR